MKKLTEKQLNRQKKFQVFRTQNWVFESLCKKYPSHFTGRMLDPCCGDNRMLKYIIKKGNTNKHCSVDIRKEEKKRAAKVCNFIIGNFLELTPPKNLFDGAILNPPFKESTQIVDRLKLWVKPGGNIWVIQRCDWLACGWRSRWHKKNKHFRKVLVMSKRPIWELDGKEKNIADTRDYAWFHYRMGYDNKGLGPRVNWLII